MPFWKRTYGVFVVLLTGASLAIAGAPTHAIKTGFATNQSLKISKIQKAKPFDLVVLTRKIKPKATEILLPKVHAGASKRIDSFVESIFPGAGDDLRIQSCHLPLKRGPPLF